MNSRDFKKFLGGAISCTLLCQAAFGWKHTEEHTHLEIEVQWGANQNTKSSIGASFTANVGMLKPKLS